MEKPKRKSKGNNKLTLRHWLLFIFVLIGVFACGAYYVVIFSFELPWIHGGEAAQRQIDRYFAVPESATNFRFVQAAGFAINLSMQFDIPANQQVLDHWLEEELDRCINSLTALTNDQLNTPEYSWANLRNADSLIGNYCAFNYLDTESIIVDQSDEELWTVHMHIFMPHR